VSQRTERIAEEIRIELADLFLREIRDPRVQLASVTRVEVSRDLGHARIWISVLGDEQQKLAAMEGLERARGFIRNQLAHRLNLRVTPIIKFELDRGAEHLREISDLLERIKSEDEEKPRDDS
jgi:ribosome-binding factor A